MRNSWKYNTQNLEFTPICSQKMHIWRGLTEAAIFKIQWWKWSMNHNPENILKILKIPPYHLHVLQKYAYLSRCDQSLQLLNCQFSSQNPKFRTSPELFHHWKFHFFMLVSGIQDQSEKLSSLVILTKLLGFHFQSIYSFCNSFHKFVENSHHIILPVLNLDGVGRYVLSLTLP